MSFSFRYAARVVPLGLLAACAASAPETDATVSDGAEITAGQIVAGVNPYYWADIPFEAHVATLAALNSPVQDNFAPDDDPLRVRLQAMADRFDVAMRAVTRNTVAPKPVVKLLKSAQTYNAWSSGTYARLGVPLGRMSSPETHVALLDIGGPSAQTVQDWSEVGPVLVHPAAWSRIGSFTQGWSLAKSACKLTSQSGRIEASRDCAYGASGPYGAVSADDVATLATSPFLTIASDLVSLMTDEKSMAFVMAHELGHMYRAHSSPLTERKYSFWYEDGPNLAKRPVPSARDAALRATLARVSRTASPLDAVTESSEPVRTRAALVALAHTTAFEACATYTQWSAVHDLASLTALAQNGAYLSEELRASYLDYERAVLACSMDGVFVNAGEAGPTPGQIELGAVSGAFSYAQAPAFPDAGETVQVYLDRLNAAATGLDADEAAFLEMVREERIGLYTVEQEADEIALELMTRVGYKAEDGINGWLDFLHAFEQISGRAEATETGDAGPVQCAAWLQEGFMQTDATGQRARVKMSLGSLADTHHGDCYRVYNLWRESKAHVYRSVPAPAPMQPSWPELVAHAAELTRQAGEAGL